MVTSNANSEGVLPLVRGNTLGTDRERQPEKSPPMQRAAGWPALSPFLLPLVFRFSACLSAESLGALHVASNPRQCYINRFSRDCIGSEVHI